mgnify:CR=1 FL=1
MSYIGNQPYNGIIRSDNIEDAQVKTQDIADAAVTEAKVANGAITAAKLAAGAAVPDQTGHAGQFLTTDGTNADWATVDALPSQTGNNGYYLTTDGSSASWAELQAGASAGMFWENDQTLTTSYSITSGKNAITAGPVTLDTGVSVTIPSGSTWVIV